MRMRVLVAALMALPVLAVAGFAAASNERSAAAVAAAATAHFHDLDAAQAAGYTIHVADAAGLTCIAQAGEGATDEQRFKAYARYSQVRTQVRYTAYKWLSVQNINNNSAIRAGLVGELTPDETAAWLQAL